jgi:hypothetical protein
VYDDVTPNNPHTTRKGDKPAMWSRSKRGVKAGKRAPVYVYHPDAEGGTLKLVGMYVKGKPVTAKQGSV